MNTTNLKPNILPRAPVIVIMGHVDHGKTTLLDYLRKSSIAGGEAGAITQKIGAYEVMTTHKDYDTDKMTIIDTPGHAAFDKLRLRGVSLADIAILIIDASESIKPQTIQSLEFIQNAKIPFVVAINKVDLPGANPDKVTKDLLRHHCIVESLGGKVPAVKISAKLGTNVPELLETIFLMAHDLKLTFDANAAPEVIVLETQKSKAGPATHCIIKNGSLKIGQIIYFGHEETKVKAILSDTNKNLKEVFPSQPFVLLGCKNLPQVGTISSTSQAEIAQSDSSPKNNFPAFDFSAPVEIKKLRLVIKVESQGSYEAIKNELEKNEKLEIMQISIGDITSNDVAFASTSGSIVVGFAVKVEALASQQALDDKVVIKTYHIIYELLEELAEVGDFFRAKQEVSKRLFSEAKIIAEFTIEGEKVAGVNVVKGQMENDENIELYRNEILIGNTKIVSIKQRAKSVKSIPRGGEGGVIFSPPLDFSVGDVVKCYRI